VLESRVNDEWLRGSVGSAHGIFPISFVHVLVPLQEEMISPVVAPSTYKAVAIYAFVAETSQDLSLQVTRRKTINSLNINTESSLFY
jgi:hypothetical protein